LRRGIASVEDIAVEEELFDGCPLLDDVVELRRGMAAAKDNGRDEGGPVFVADDKEEFKGGAAA
jgi:hypothetical protein